MLLIGGITFVFRWDPCTSMGTRAPTRLFPLMHQSIMTPLPPPTRQSVGMIGHPLDSELTLSPGNKYGKSHGAALYPIWQSGAPGRNSGKVVYQLSWDCCGIALFDLNLIPT